MSGQKLFFSYSRSDSTFALKLARDLRDAGAEIWIDQLDIPAGNHWDSAVEKALNTAGYVLVILSPASTASTNVMDEVSFALESGKKIIPVLLEDCLAPFRLRRLQRIDFTTDYAAGFNQLVQSLNLVVDGGMKTFHSSGSAEPVHTQPQDLAAEATENQKRENLLWEEACRLNTIASYKFYLNESLTGDYKTEAKLLIKQLEVEQKEDELEALLWQQAKAEDSKNLYLHYLQEYPQGNYKTLALAAVADLEKAERDEQNRLKELERQQEKERALQAKQEREKLAQQEREKALREKEEREKIRQEEKAQALLEKQARDKEKQIEKERLAQEKHEREQQKQLEKEKALKEKQERERLRQEERAKAVLEGKEPAEEHPSQGVTRKRSILIGAGILVLVVGIWAMTRSGSGSGPDSGDDDQDSWNEAITANDSTAFAMYLLEFPDGKHYTEARKKIDSLGAVNQNRKDSLRSVEEKAQMAAQQKADSIQKAQSASVSEPPKKSITPATKPKPSTQPAKSTTSSKPAAKFTLGQAHNGGIVIFINSTGEHGLIAAEREEGKYSWSAAQRRCAAYKKDGFTDWRVPTRDELGLLYHNRRYLKDYTKGIYWSSSEESKDIAWALNFINGSTGKYDKGSANSVWAVHTF